MFHQELLQRRRRKFLYLHIDQASIGTIASRITWAPQHLHNPLKLYALSYFDSLIYNADRLFTFQQQFRFRTRYITTAGTVISSLHSDVLRLVIQRPVLLRFLDSCFRRISSFVWPWISPLFPEWFLPDHVVLKPERKDERDLFDTELRAYEYLKPAQGTLVPRVYGQVMYNKTRALLLEDLGGIPLASPEGAILELEKLSELLQECFRSLHSLGVHQ